MLNELFKIKTFLEDKGDFKNKIFSVKEFERIINSIGFKPSDFKDTFRISNGNYSFRYLDDLIIKNKSSLPTMLPKKEEVVAVVVPSQKEMSQVKFTLPEFNVNYYIPNVKDDFVPYGFSSALKMILKSKRFFPVYVTGHSGTGKNIAIEQCCVSLKKPLIHYSITEDTTEDDLIGCWTLLNGNTVWKEGPVVLAARYGMVCVLDEIDLATPKIMCLQSILNGDPIIIHSTGEKLYPKEGFTIIATGNTKGFGDSAIYVGTQALNEAFLERFKVTFEHTFPTEIVLKKIIANKMVSFSLLSNEDKQFGEILSKFIFHIGKAFESGALGYYISNRRLSAILETYSIFGDKVKALTFTLKRFPKEVAESFLSLYTKMDENLVMSVEDVLNVFRESSSELIVEAEEEVKPTEVSF